MHRCMSDSRQSPIPQDRVNENVDQAHRAKDNQQQMAEQESAPSAGRTLRWLLLAYESVNRRAEACP
jgi:hypothetical protein